MMELNFKRLEAEDVRALSPYFSLRSNLTCDSVIFDSYLWRDYYQVEWALAETAPAGDAAVLIRMREDDIDFAALPVCSDEDLPGYFRVLEQYFEEELGQRLRVYGADEAGLAVLNLDPARYEIRETPDAADYIYDAESLRTLAGRKYHKKKNHVNAFLRAYADRWEYRRLTRAAKPEIWEFLERWEKTKGDEVEVHLDAEMQGLHDYLENMDCFDAVTGGIYLDGTLEAFSVGSYNRLDRMSVVHVEKANGEIRGLYTLMNQQFQIHEFPEAVLVNREDDVGLPSLRRAKESYHPIQMARKYQIIRR
ncbi:MAG: phosphatidylglycerol lysyltransferase domain-containing protein [Lachnospiraceae bacterium]|nr:phosphatidylglycerol lysyltransferase domain-containing protein [Lachnospiraceae bacterium]